jgi:predicted transcriptional regulator with HTH domain
MPNISNEKKEKISEQIISYMFSLFPKPLFTSEIAKEVARDEEFIKRLLHNLEKREAVIKIDKNPKGKKYALRKRWRLSNKAHLIYKNHQQHI